MNVLERDGYDVTSYLAPQRTKGRSTDRQEHARHSTRPPAAGVHSRLGMECYSGPRPDQRSSIEWFRGAMNRLGEFGRIDDAKARDLLGITGWTSLGANGGVHRQMNHLKVIDSPGHPLEIKAYLALSLRVAPSFTAPGVAKESVRRAESA